MKVSANQALHDAIVIRDYIRGMAQRQYQHPRARCSEMRNLWVAHRELAVAPGHPFYRLNELLDSEGFDAFVESQCAKFYAVR